VPVVFLWSFSVEGAYLLSTKLLHMRGPVSASYDFSLLSFGFADSALTTKQRILNMTFTCSAGVYHRTSSIFYGQIVGVVFDRSRK
jgi:hypothetical protein